MSVHTGAIRVRQAVRGSSALFICFPFSQKALPASARRFHPHHHLKHSRPRLTSTLLCRSCTHLCHLLSYRHSSTTRAIQALCSQWLSLPPAPVRLHCCQLLLVSGDVSALVVRGDACFGNAEKLLHCSICCDVELTRSSVAGAVGQRGGRGSISCWMAGE